MDDKKFNSIDLALAITWFTKKSVLHSDIIKYYRKIENAFVWNREIISCTLVVTGNNDFFYKDMNDSLVVMILLEIGLNYHDIDKVFGFYHIKETNEEMRDVRGI